MEQRIAIYLRLSLEDVDNRTNKIKDESNSISAQRVLINRYLDSHADLSAIDRVEFRDDGFSGTNFERPDFLRMIDHAKQGMISCIIVKDLSRFGRDYLEVGDYLEHIFPFLGIRFISINDNYDSAMHEGRTIGMDVAFKNIIYDYYSKDLSKKVKSAMSLKQREGKFVTCIPYGYKAHPTQKHQMIIDEAVAPIVRQVFLDVVSGKKTTEIARELNDSGVLPPAEYKGVSRNTGKKPQWTHKSILEMIANIKYTGTMVNHTRESRYIRDKNQRHVPKDEWYINENAHEAIVSQKEFEAANQAIHRRKYTTRISHDQSDRVYYCGHCGAKLEKANGKVFSCHSRRIHADSVCNDVCLIKSEIEDVLFEALKRQIAITHIETSKKEKDANVKAVDLVKQLAALKGQYDFYEHKKFTLYESYRGEKLTADNYLAQKADLSHKQSEIRGQLSEIEQQMASAEILQDDCKKQAKIVDAYVGLSEEELRSHLYDAIEKVIVYDRSNIEIVWKFNEMLTAINESVEA